MKILTAPHTILTQKSESVKQINQRIVKLIEEMKIILNAQTDPPGVGLAAPQIGSALRIFLMKPTKKSLISVFINPAIINDKTHTMQDKTSANRPEPKANSKLEGCLSLPRIWGKVERAKTICIEYTNVEGERKKDCFSGFEAVIIQHELDHLEGILFTQRVVEQNESLYEERAGDLVPLTIE